MNVYIAAQVAMVSDIEKRRMADRTPVAGFNKTGILLRVEAFVFPFICEIIRRNRNTGVALSLANVINLLRVEFSLSVLLFWRPGVPARRPLH